MQSRCDAHFLFGLQVRGIRRHLVELVVSSFMYSRCRQHHSAPFWRQPDSCTMVALSQVTATSLGQCRSGRLTPEYSSTSVSTPWAHGGMRVTSRITARPVGSVLSFCPAAAMACQDHAHCYSYRD